jgi:hypothetical protein
VAAVLFALLMLGCGADESEEREANSAIIGDLPVYPGATEGGRETSPYTLADSGPPDGYTTRVTYRVPAGTSASAVADFYESAMVGGWQNLGREEVSCFGQSGGSQCDIIIVRFRSGDAMVAVNTDNVTSSASSFDVAVEATRCEHEPDDAYCHP